MPHSEQLNLATLADLARQVPGFLGDLISFPPSGGEVELRESFKVYELPYGSMHEESVESKSFDGKVAWSGSWHIQLYWRRGDAQEKFPNGYVRARKDGRWSISGVFISELARTIDRIIGDLSALPEASIARLLIVPSHYLHTLWIREPGKADRFFALETSLKRTESYSETELFAQLRVLPPSIGVGWKNPRSDAKLGELKQAPALAAPAKPAEPKPPKAAKEKEEKAPEPLTPEEEEALAALRIELGLMVEAVLASHPKEVERYRAGQTGTLGFLVAQTMKRVAAGGGKPNPKLINLLLQQELGQG